MEFNAECLDTLQVDCAEIEDSLSTDPSVQITCAMDSSTCKCQVVETQSGQSDFEYQAVGNVYIENMTEQTNTQYCIQGNTLTERPSGPAGSGVVWQMAKR